MARAQGGEGGGGSFSLVVEQLQMLAQVMLAVLEDPVRGLREVALLVLERVLEQPLRARARSRDHAARGAADPAHVGKVGRNAAQLLQVRICRPAARRRCAAAAAAAAATPTPTAACGCHEHSLIRCRPQLVELRAQLPDLHKRSIHHTRATGCRQRTWSVSRRWCVVESWVSASDAHLSTVCRMWTFLMRKCSRIT